MDISRYTKIHRVENTMKILHITGGHIRIPPKMGGGAEAVIYNISRQMAIKGHDVTILDRSYSKNDSPVDKIGDMKIIRIKAFKFQFLDHLIKFGFGHYVTAVKEILNEIYFSLKVYLIFKDRVKEYSIIHFHSIFAGCLLSKLFIKSNPNIYYTSHQTTWALEFGFWSKYLLIPIEVCAMKNSKKIIALNDPLRTKIIQVSKINPEKIMVIGNGVDTAIFNTNINIENIVRKYELDDSYVKVLFVGRIVESKGIEYLIEAINIIINTFNNKKIKFFLVGPYSEAFDNKNITDTYCTKIFNLIKKYNLEKNVLLTGAVPIEEIFSFYAACDIFVLPSLGELFGLVITEAMATGKPIIGSNIMGISDQIIDGWNGYLVEPANKRKLAERIMYLYEHPEERKRMGENSRKLVEQKFDWSIISEKYIGVYQSLPKDK